MSTATAGLSAEAGATPSYIHSAAAVGYGNEDSTAKYEAGRPSYPPALVDQLLARALQRSCPPSSAQPAAGEERPRQTVRVLDVGAGTGIFTRVLQQRLLHYEQQVDPSLRFQLTAVEPVEGMRSKFKEVTGSSVPVVCGSGRELSAAAAASSVSVIFCAQAFHWMASQETLDEFARVLVPDGAVVLIWNTRDRRQPAAAALERLVDELYPADVPRQESGDWRRAFELEGVRQRWSPLESLRLDGEVRQEGDLQLMLDRIMSISVIASLSPQEQADVQRRVTDIVLTQPERAGQPRFCINYITECYLAYKLQ